MPDFNTKMQQNRFRLGLRPRPLWGSLQRSPDPLAGFKGPTSKVRGGEGRGCSTSLPPRFDNPRYGPDPAKGAPMHQKTPVLCVGCPNPRKSERMTLK